MSAQPRKRLTTNCRTNEMKNLSCMSYVGKGNAFIVVAGCQDVMLKIDVERGRIIEEVYMDLYVLFRNTNCMRSQLSISTP